LSHNKKATKIGVGNHEPLELVAQRFVIFFKMISIEKLKKIDPKLAHLSDDEILEIRSSLYDLGGLMFEDWLENGDGSKYPVRFLQRLRESNKMDVCQPEEPKQE
jgi:hypothetical protein